MATRNTGGIGLAWRRLRNAIRPGVEVKKFPSGVRAEWDMPVKVRDGTTLRVNVFRPIDDGAYPVIMSAHPYSKDRIPARTRSGRNVNFQYRLFPQPRPVSFSEWTSWEAPDPGVWVPLGYIVVNADLRGGGTSEGTGELFSDQEAHDYYDLIEWAGTQPWSNGRVGLDGVSYLAISQYKVAALHPPHLAAMCPWEGFSDPYRDFMRPGGIREDGFSVVWSKATGKLARIRGNIRKEVVTRPERDDWYRSITPDLEQIEVPILVCGSFSDHSLHSRGSFEVFRRAGSKKKWLYTHRDGKWCAYYKEEATAARIRFFDWALKDIENGWREQAPAHVEVHDRGAEPVAVVDEDAWPPSDLRWGSLWLDARSMAMTETGVNAWASISFPTRGRGVCFVWTVPQDVDIIGPMALRLWIEVQGADDVFLFAGIRKFRAAAEVKFEGSYGFSGDMVSKGWQRAAHRGIDEKLSTRMQPVHTHERAEPLRPGEIVPVEIALMPHATRFLKGDKLRLDVRGKWHYPRNPLFGQFPAAYKAAPKAKCVLHTGAYHDACLLLGSRPVAVTAAKAGIIY